MQKPDKSVLNKTINPKPKNKAKKLKTNIEWN